MPIQFWHPLTTLQAGTPPSWLFFKVSPKGGQKLNWLNWAWNGGCPFQSQDVEKQQPEAEMLNKQNAQLYIRKRQTVTFPVVCTNPEISYCLLNAKANIVYIFCLMKRSLRSEHTFNWDIGMVSFVWFLFSILCFLVGRILVLH